MCGGFLDNAFDFIGDVAGGLGKSFGNALSGDFGSLMNIAALIPGPQQPFLMGANALQKFTDDDPLGRCSLQRVLLGQVVCSGKAPEQPVVVSLPAPASGVSVIPSCRT